MPRISVLIPTHEHAATLPYAVRSVQNQNVDDLEILICGDGVTDEVRAAVADMQRSDRRIRFFDLPKGPNIGECNRDEVLQQAQGEIVCIQNDDDLWLPRHVEILQRSLQDADFAGAMQVNVGTDDKVRGYYFDLERPEFVTPWLDMKPNHFGAWAANGFGPIFVGFRRDAYLRLPERWTTTPAGLTSDQTMWRKFLRQPWCRARFIRWPIALHFGSSDRQGWTAERRAEELRRWTQIVEAPDYAVRIWRDLLPDLGDRLLAQVPHGPLGEILAAHDKETLRVKAEEQAFICRIRELEAELAATRSAAAAQVANLRAEFDATRDASTTRIKELEAELAATRSAAATQIADVQAQSDATRDASITRIKELEAELAATRSAAAAQMTGVQAQFDATRDASVARIRELETEIAAARAAADKRTGPAQMLRRIAGRLRRAAVGLRHDT